MLDAEADELVGEVRRPAPRFGFFSKGGFPIDEAGQRRPQPRRALRPIGALFVAYMTRPRAEGAHHAGIYG